MKDTIERAYFQAEEKTQRRLTVIPATIILEGRSVGRGRVCR